MLALLLVFPAPPCGATETPPLRLASWNVENYLLQNRWEHGRYRFAYPKPERAKKRLRAELLRARPDVLLLQEVGGDAFLRELQLDLAASGLELPYRHCAVAPGARGGLGLLSRVPPQEVLFHDPVPLDDPQLADAVLRRGVQEIALSWHGRRLRLFHVHLKSRYTSDPADPESARARAAELRAVQRLLEARRELDRDALPLLAGDLNTPFDAPQLEGLRAGWAPVAPVDAAGAGWTYLHLRSGARERIDGFWAPRHRSGELHPVALFPLHPDAPPASDHRMVVVELVNRRTASTSGP